jgi:NAD(P)-dependent dehydrogenase (short-subunit alcohol dehydrogenase family)
MKCWLLTGCSSGFGRALAELALARGDRVAVTARRVEDVADIVGRYGGSALPVAMDVTSPEQVRKGLQRTVAAFGRIDVLVNNAGYGLQGAIEDVTDAQIRQVFETNVFGLLDVVRAALPQLRGQGRAHILNFSSIGGRAAAPLIGLYAATKFAVEGLSEALAGELAPHGIRLTIVEPGPFATRFADSLVQAPPSAPYAATAAAVAEVLRNFRPDDPVGASRVLLKVVDAPDPPLRFILGGQALAMADAALERSHTELDRWRALSLEASSTATLPATPYLRW